MSKQITEAQLKQAIDEAVEQAVNVNTEMVVKRTVQEMFNYYNDMQDKRLADSVQSLADEINKNFTKEINKSFKKTDEHTKEIKVNRLHNTRQLIFNYRKLRAHCDTIPEHLEELELNEFDYNKLYLNTMMERQAKTYKMLKHLEAVWLAYGAWAKNEGEQYHRRFKILDRLYVNQEKLSGKALEELFNISNRQVYRDRDEAIKDLQPFLFGYSALDTR